MRGSIVDVFPSTADVPVRIDLWGDEVDRLTEFSVADQRSTDDARRGRDLPVPRAAATDDVRARGRELVGDRAVGPRAVGAAGRGPHVRRHGVVAAVAHRRRAPPLRPRSAPTPWCCSSSPAACATGPATCSTRRPTCRAPSPARGAPATRTHCRACTCRSTGCSPTPRRRRVRSSVTPRGTADTDRGGVGWDPVVGDGDALSAQLTRPRCADGYRVVIAAEGEASAARLAGLLRERGVDLPVDGEPVRPGWHDRGRAARAGLRPRPRSSSPCSPRPTSPAAAGPTAAPRPRARDAPASSTT